MSKRKYSPEEGERWAKKFKKTLTDPVVNKLQETHDKYYSKLTRARDMDVFRKAQQLLWKAEEEELTKEDIEKMKKYNKKMDEIGESWDIKEGETRASRAFYKRQFTDELEREREWYKEFPSKDPKTHQKIEKEWKTLETKLKGDVLPSKLKKAKESFHKSSFKRFIDQDYKRAGYIREPGKWASELSEKAGDENLKWEAKHQINRLRYFKTPLRSRKLLKEVLARPRNQVSISQRDIPFVEHLMKELKKDVVIKQPVENGRVERIARARGKQNLVRYAKYHLPDPEGLWADRFNQLIEPPAPIEEGEFEI